MINYRIRRAIAMIELIFAIVVMGFAMMSIPNLLALSANSGYTSLQQEAIATISSDISLVFSREWDESNNIKSISEVILQTNGDDNLNARDGGVVRGYGQIPIPSTDNSQLGPDLDENHKPDSDDIDDANNHQVELTKNDIGTDKASRGNIDQAIVITTRVQYIADSENVGEWDNSQQITYNYPLGDTATNLVVKTFTTNIKNIRSNLTSNTTVKELQKNISISAFSCNIGGYKIDRKVLP